VLSICTALVLTGMLIFLHWSSSNQASDPVIVPTTPPATEATTLPDPTGEEEDEIPNDHTEGNAEDSEGNPDDDLQPATDPDPEDVPPEDEDIDHIISLDTPPPIRADTMVIVNDPFFVDTLFIGDSITTGLDRHAQFDNRLLADIGLTVERATNRIHDFKALEPSKIFILLGANDMGYFYMNPTVFAERYRTLIATLRELFPDAGIFPQSILPVANYYRGVEALNNDNIISFNEALQELCAELGLRYIDIGAPWRLPDASLHPDVSSGDGLHIKFAYYGTWLLHLIEMSSME